MKTKHIAQIHHGLQVWEGFPADILSKLRLYMPVAIIWETVLNRACNENIYLSQAQMNNTDMVPAPWNRDYLEEKQFIGLSE